MIRKRKRYTRTVFKQLVLLTVVTSILPIALISAFMFHKVESMAEREIMDSYGQLALQYTQAVREKIMRYESSVRVLSQNTTIMEQLEDDDGNIYTRGSLISSEVFKSLLLEDQSEIRSCMVYTGAGEKAAYGSSVSTREAAERENWYQYYQGQIREWFFYPEFDGKSSVASIICQIQKTDLFSFQQTDLGIIKLDISMDRLFAPADHDAQSRNFEVYVYDDEGRIWYSSEKNAGMSMPGERNLTAQAEKFEEGKVIRVQNRLVSCSRLNSVQLNISFLFGDRMLMEKRTEVKKLLFPMVLALIVCVMAASYVFTRRFSQRVNMLVNKFKVAETGNLAITDPIPGNDEITVLDLQFSHMLQKLDLLIQRNYVQEVAHKEMQLKNLQLQINPHFLYNTLETISSIAAVKQIFVVCDICEKLGEIFRYSLGKDHGEFVTVEQELHHVQNYIFIQKLRYENKFEVFFNIEKGTETCMILRFILQPIVENAILHGLDPMTGRGTIEISVIRHEDKLLVKIEDDGVGMSWKEKENLKQYMNHPGSGKDDKKSIGVRNVNQRIRLACGEAYGIQIESSPYRGSCFNISLPLKTKGEEKDV